MRLMCTALVMMMASSFGCGSTASQHEFEFMTSDVMVESHHHEQLLDIGFENWSGDFIVEPMNDSKLSSAFSHVAPNDDAVGDISESELWSDCLSWEVDDNGEEYCNVYEER